MIKDKFSDGTGGFSKDITEDVVQLEIGDSQTVLPPVLLTGEDIGKLHAVTNQITKMADVGGRDKAWFNHIAHEKITDPFGILAVSLIALLRLGVLRMGKGDKDRLFEEVKDGNPILTGRFHADFLTGVLGKPKGQFLKTFGEGRETSLLVLSKTVCIGNADTGIDPGLVDIQTAAVFTENFEHGSPS